jgi:YegS/Rv2252/BmrU family lipid kinase
MENLAGKRPEVRKGDQIVVQYTQVPGDARRFAHEAINEFDAVIGAGGDGTIHELIAALAGTGMPFGIVPWGTGNVFAREMKFPRRIRALGKIIRQGRAYNLDLGMADGLPFLLMASIGIDAYALARVPSGPFKRRWGLLSYALSAVQAFIFFHHPKISVQFDEGFHDSGSYILVSNTRLYGAFFVFHPRAQPADGLLDVLVFRTPGRWSFLWLVISLAWHSFWHRRSPHPALALRAHGIYQTKGLTIQPNQAPFQADGDVLPMVHRIEIAPASLRMLLPKKALRRLKALRINPKPPPG